MKKENALQAAVVIFLSLVFVALGSWFLVSIATWLVDNWKIVIGAIVLVIVLGAIFGARRR